MKRHPSVSYFFYFVKKFYCCGTERSDTFRRDFGLIILISLH